MRESMNIKDWITKLRGKPKDRSGVRTYGGFETYWEYMKFLGSPESNVWKSQSPPGNLLTPPDDGVEPHAARS
jgi:hypothetical protein